MESRHFWWPLVTFKVIHVPVLQAFFRCDFRTTYWQDFNWQRVARSPSPRSRRRHCRVWRRSKYSALRSLTDSLSLRTWMMSSVRVRGPCTPSAYYGLTAWRRQLYTRSSARSSSLSSLTPPRQRIDAVLRRAARSDLWTSAGMSDAQTFEDRCNSADEELFIKIRTFSNHILHALLPPPSTASQNYSLRHREHSFLLPERSSHLFDCNFFMRTNERTKFICQWTESQLLLGPVTVLVFYLLQFLLCFIVFVLCRCAFCHAFFYNKMILIKLRVLYSSCWMVVRTPCAGACMNCAAEKWIILSSTTCLITADIC